MIDVSSPAVAVIRRSLEAARRISPEVKIRLTRAGEHLVPVLAEGPERHDRALDLFDDAVFVEEELDGLIDVEAPHDRLVLRPLGAAPAARPE